MAELYYMYRNLTVNSNNLKKIQEFEARLPKNLSYGIPKA